MITQDELDVFVNELIDEHGCDGDSCPIDFGGADDSK